MLVLFWIVRKNRLPFKNQRRIIHRDQLDGIEGGDKPDRSLHLSVEPGRSITERGLGCVELPWLVVANSAPVVSLWRLALLRKCI